jgi:phage terminase small subunit
MQWNDDTPFGKVSELEAGLTDKQVMTCRYIAAGLSQTEAGTTAGYSPKTAHASVSRMLKNVKVQKLLNALRFQNRLANTKDRLKKRQHLAWLMDHGTNLEMLAAIRVDNLMTGDNKPVEIDLGSDRLADILKKIRATKD